ncbi:TPA: hypothetical protein DHW51_15505, partial [Candidatus Poribacteria bacterium]|nr:hypothetical protein [Candidatus Poribacteria bacterium]
MKETDEIEPFIINKNLGKHLDPAKTLTQTNAEGLSAVKLSQEEKYLFDIRGWILFEGILTADQVKEMRDFCYRLKNDTQSITEHHRSSIGGPLEQLTDHPLLLGFMNEFVAHPPLASQDCYGFRMDHSGLLFRKAGEGSFSPHNGNGILRFPGDSCVYRCIPGKVNAGMVRVAWELNPVEKGEGGTLFVTGSHKGVFTAPESLQSPDSPIWETYSCPEGSVIFFTEALTHSPTPWKSEKYDRVPIFNCYNTVNSKWHNWNPHPDHVAEM